MAGWVCPRLGGRFNLPEDKLEIYRPDREGFAPYIELAQRVEQERQEKEQVQQLVEQYNNAQNKLNPNCKPSNIY